jgi:hypothetical protein
MEIFVGMTPRGVDRRSREPAQLPLVRWQDRLWYALYQSAKLAPSSDIWHPCKIRVFYQVPTVRFEMTYIQY